MDLLETQVVSLLIEVAQGGSVPLLVTFGVLLLQATDILGQLLEYLFLELTLRLARVKLAIGKGRSGFDALAVNILKLELFG